MIKRLLLAVICVVPGAGAIAADQATGKADCVPHSNGSGCAIRWDFARTPRGFYQLEVLDENSLTWRALGRPYGAFHSQSDPVQPGRLYRVRGCDDEAMTRECVSSTVQWTVTRPAPQEIPDFLVDGNGIEMHIVRNAPAEVQIAQYNVYRLVQLLDRVPDLSTFPPMTEPGSPYALAAGRDDDQRILSGIYENYSERRRQALQSD